MVQGVNTIVGAAPAMDLDAQLMLRVRDGEIVESRDYADHVTVMRVLGRLDALAAALKNKPIPA